MKAREVAGFVSLGVVVTYFAGLMYWSTEVWNLQPTLARLGVILAWPALIGLTVWLLWERSQRLKDRGFLKSAGGKARTWEKVPITPFVPRDLSEAWRQTIVEVLEHVNKRVGFRVFWPVQMALPEMRMDTPGYLSVKFRDDGGEDPDHGSTVFYPGEPPTTSALVTVPRGRDRELTGEERFALVLHEVGHVLGLDHDDRADSIMFPVLRGRPREMLAMDIERIKGTYEKRQLGFRTSE